MIPQLLNRDSVTRDGMEVVKALGANADHQDPLVREVVAALHGAASVPSGDLSKEDEVAFIPSHLPLSLVQALIDEAAHGNEPGSGTGDRAAEGIRLRRPEQPPSPLVTEQLVRYETDGTGLEAVDEFEPTDPRWWGKLGLTVARYLGKRVAFRLNEEPPATTDLDENAMVVLVSDWGTGAHDAQRVSSSIRSVLDQAGDRQTHVIHLGDVYYAGTKWEARHRFLDPWPVGVEEAARHHSWTMNGNHDMYAAGEGLFEVTLRDPRFGLQRTAASKPRATTMFRLANPDWQILGLDSSWKFDLADPANRHGVLGRWQSDWLTATVPSSRNTILLTHHQPFSRSESDPSHLALEEALLSDTEGARARGVAAWFWGHEHRCIVFPSPAIAGLDYGACVGNGGVPKAPGLVVTKGDEWEFQTPKPPDWDGQIWRKSGFAVIEFRGGRRPVVTYHDQDGGRVHGPDPLG